ncbi:MAG: polysaccharide deacetylase family protein [Elusimicrobia bacterium]|nr:polysaccharide deacetylase family protein [Elusimicrobiota bacterium]
MKTPLVRFSVAAALFAAAAVGVLAYGLGAPQATLLGPAIIRQAEAGEVALTFDDGPSPYTAQVLDVLKREGVKATFFLCGENAERYPELVRRIRAEGHQIGNHTYSHPYLYLMREADIASEIDRTQTILEKISGSRPTLFRPPYGVRWFSLWPLLRERGLTMVMWSDRGYDGRFDARGVAKTTLDQLAPGAIILLHDGFETHAPSDVDRSATVGALPAIIAGVRKAGYRFGRLRG